MLTALPKSEVFHFAGHSLANSAVPAASELVVAGNASDAITAAEISRLSLRRMRLVVLSSCQSAVGVETRSEGPLGLAQAFLSAGAENVIATLTPVGDRPARELSVVFHREFQRLRDPVLALQAAQRTLLASADPTLSVPNAWAPFVVIGKGTLAHVN